jgi:hypothetical protein
LTVSVRDSRKDLKHKEEVDNQGCVIYDADI